MSRPVYHARAWLSGGWWVARVESASADAATEPVGAITEVRTRSEVWEAARDLITTVLDDDDFSLTIEYFEEMP